MNYDTPSNTVKLIARWSRRLLLSVGLASATLHPVVLRAQTVGAVDAASFGVANGFAYFDGTNTADVRGAISQVAAQPDGSVLAAGTCLLPPGYVQGWACLMRWSAANGNTWPDVTFGAGGVSYAIANTAGTRFVTRKDGRLWVVGSCLNASQQMGCSAVVNANGVGFDTSYGTSGSEIIPVPAGFAQLTIQDIVLQPDGKLLVAGYCEDNGAPLNHSFCITRLTATGALDPTFGVNRWATTIPGPGDRLARIKLLGDGSFLATGTCGTTTFTGAISCTLRFDASGNYVSSTYLQWGTDRSEAVYDFTSRDGTVTLAGDATDAASDWRMYVSRLTLGGLPDTSFGGTYPASGTGGNINIETSGLGYTRVAKVLRDGSTLFMGQCGNGTSLCSARFAPSGVLDATYGNSGRYAYAAPHSPFSGLVAQLTTMDETANGRILVGGFCRQGAIDRPCVRRYLGSTVHVAACTMDIDGDGVVNPATDGLLLTRISLGIKGSAALAGALGASATRTTWTQVRDYLFSECNMPVAP